MTDHSPSPPASVLNTMRLLRDTLRTQPPAEERRNLPRPMSLMCFFVEVATDRGDQRRLDFEMGI